MDMNFLSPLFPYEVDYVNSLSVSIYFFPGTLIMMPECLIHTCPTGESREERTHLKNHHGFARAGRPELFFYDIT